MLGLARLTRCPPPCAWLFSLVLIWTEVHWQHHAVALGGLLCGGGASSSSSSGSGEASQQQAVPVSPVTALCLVSMGLPEELEGAVTADLLRGLSPDACASHTQSDISLATDDEFDAALMTAQVYVQWDGDSGCMSVIWTLPALNSSSEQLYLIQISENLRSGAEQFLTGSSYATLGNSLTLHNISRSTLSSSNISLAVIDVNGTILPLSRTVYTLLPGQPRHARTSSQYYDFQRAMALRNLTWNRPEDGSTAAEQHYDIHFSGSKELGTFHPCPDWSVNDHTGTILFMQMLTQLRYGCLYVATITPALPAQIRADLAERDDVSIALQHSFPIDHGAANVSDFDFVNGTTQFATCDSALNAHFSLDASFTYNGSALAFVFALDGFNASQLLVPPGDFLASLDFFSVIVTDVSVGPFGSRVFSQDLINPYQFNHQPFQAIVSDPQHLHNYRAEARYAVYLAEDIPLYNAALLTATDSRVNVRIQSLSCGTNFRLTVNQPTTALTAGSTTATSGSAVSNVTSHMPPAAMVQTTPPSTAAVTTITFMTVERAIEKDALDQSSPTVAIAAGVAGVIVILMIGMMVGYILVRNRNHGRTKSKPLRPLRSSVESTITIMTQIEANACMSDSCDDYELEPGRLQMLDVVGSGAFGIVRKAHLYQSCDWDQDKSRLVAAKMLRENGIESDRQDLLSEISRMKDISRHEHIVTLVGCCTMSEPIALVAEWMPHGSLAQLLRDTLRRKRTHGPGSTPTYEQHEGPYIRLTEGGHIFAGDVCSFGKQVAQGMVYVKTSTGPAPLKWMALESLILRHYSTHTDVWSFGVLLWEICTFADLPYSNVPNSKLISYLKADNRLACPAGCPNMLYTVMKSCWTERPEERPSFSELVDCLTHLPDCLYDQVDGGEVPSSGEPPTFSFSALAYTSRPDSGDDNAYISGGSSLMTSSDVSTGGYSGVDTSASTDSGYGMRSDTSASTMDTGHSDSGGYLALPVPAHRRARKKASTALLSPPGQQQPLPANSDGGAGKLDQHGYLPLDALQTSVQELLTASTGGEQAKEGRNTAAAPSLVAPSLSKHMPLTQYPVPQQQSSEASLHTSICVCVPPTECIGSSQVALEPAEARTALESAAKEQTVTTASHGLPSDVQPAAANGQMQSDIYLDVQDVWSYGL
ncbi:uncharacterized protein LOC135829308 isoform X2 [Sycon ciliatum]|uniref:uncharacterized protein LOC135829308 isoform X2 n=1 Tax=Sycon ciliatum TaxID=27933 RepID=UPI0031F6BB65